MSVTNDAEVANLPPPASAGAPGGRDQNTDKDTDSYAERRLPVLGPAIQLSASEVLEATEATALEVGHQIEIQLGHFCNNRCVFCMSGQLTEAGHAQPVDLAPIRRLLEEAAAKGIRRVTFLGGEPTIQDSFLGALDAAIELGFDDIVIFTNGARGKSQAFLESVLARGSFTWRFSVQGGNAEAHDRVTQRPGAFERIDKAMAFLASRGAKITVNMCLTAMSHRSLPDFPALLLKHGVEQLHIDMVRPENTGVRDEAHQRSIVGRYTDMAPDIAEMLRRFEAHAPGVEVHIGNLPFCVLPEWVSRIHHGGEATLTMPVDLGGENSRILRKYEHQAEGMVFAPTCTQCVLRASCRGLPGEYVRYHGVDELQALTVDALRDADPSGRSVELTERDVIQRALRAPLPRALRSLKVLTLQSERGLLVAELDDPRLGVVRVEFGPREASTDTRPFCFTNARVGVRVAHPEASIRARLVRWLMDSLRAQGVPGLVCQDAEALRLGLALQLARVEALRREGPRGGFTPLAAKVSRARREVALDFGSATGTLRLSFRVMDDLSVARRVSRVSGGEVPTSDVATAADALLVAYGLDASR